MPGRKQAGSSGLLLLPSLETNAESSKPERSESPGVASRQIDTALIRFECVLVVQLERRVLIFFFQKAVANYQDFDIRAHKTVKSIFGRADNWLAAHVKAGIDQYRATGDRFELRQQSVIASIGLRMHGLNTCRVVDMRDGRNFRPCYVQFVDTEQGLIRRIYCPAVFFDDIGDDEHIRAVGIEFEPVGEVFA